jgi:hypothetical protein
MADKIYIQIDDEKIELTGKAKDEFLADRALIESTRALAEEAEAQRISARAALLERLGMTEDEAKLLLG